MNRKNKLDPIQIDRNVTAFNRDIEANSGYLYTTNSQLSARMANRRLTEATLTVADFSHQRVLDVGCGDGTYTFSLFDCSAPKSMRGVDLAAEAIKVAQQQVKDQAITFEVASCYDLPYQDQSFDLVYLRGVLHHLDSPVDALQEALRVAPTVVVVEPNGYNPILKLLEKFSPYHVEHKEKSYSPHQIDRWINQLGAKVNSRLWAGLVPMFCPDWMARFLKVIEPFVERLPLLSHVGCAVYVFAATRDR